MRNSIWYEWKGWPAVSSIVDIIIGILTLLTIVIAFYQLVDNKKIKIEVFSMFSEGKTPIKYFDKIYKMHSRKKYLKVMKLQAHKNSIMIRVSSDLVTTWQSRIFPHTSTDTIIDSDRYNPTESLIYPVEQVRKKQHGSDRTDL